MNHNVFYFDNGVLFFNGNETELIATGLIDEQFDVEEKFPVFYGMRVGKYVVHWHANTLIHSDFCRLFFRETELITGERPDQYQIESVLQFASRKHVQFCPSSIVIDKRNELWIGCMVGGHEIFVNGWLWYFVFLNKHLELFAPVGANFGLFAIKNGENVVGAIMSGHPYKIRETAVFTLGFNNETL